MVYSSNSTTIHQDDLHTGNAKRAVASGVASLDAGTLVPVAQIPIHGAAKHSADGHPATGNYTGNGSANRAVAHGLGRIPYGVMITHASGSNYWLLTPSFGETVYIASGQYPILATVTIMDASYFYVGNASSYSNSANNNTTGYNFVAW